MSVADPLSDMLTRVRNANSVKHSSVDIPASRVKREVARILKEQGYIKEYRSIEDDKQGVVRVYLKYGPNRSLVINGIRRISKPGLRVYANKEEIPKVLGGLGIAVISTSNGIMSDDEARSAGIGGEVLCYVW